MKQHCTKCGSKMIKCKIPAYKFNEPMPYPIPPTFWTPYKKHDKKTGKVRMFDCLKCPKTWFYGLTSHDVKVL